MAEQTRPAEWGPLRPERPGVRPDGRARAPETRSFRGAGEEGDGPRTYAPGLATHRLEAIGRAADSVFAVIPCLNEAAHIEGLVSDLLDDPDWIDPLVVVADGGSTDGTVDIVRQIAARDARVRLIDNPGRLQSAGVNLAAAQFGLGRRWMVRVDAHAGYPPRYVSRLLAEGLARKAASVVVGMRTQGQGGFQSAAAAAQNSVLGAGGSAHRCGAREGWVDHGHHALFDLEYFLGAGGYDETFRANEDAEFDIRLVKANGRIWLSSDIAIAYYPRRTPGALFRQYLHYGRGRARTLLKHRGRPKVRQLLPVAVLPAAAAAPFGLVDGVLAAPFVVWAVASLLCGLAIGLKKRQASACASGAAAMVMHLGWSVGFWAQLASLRPRWPTQARHAVHEGAN